MDADYRLIWRTDFTKTLLTVSHNCQSVWGVDYLLNAPVWCVARICLLLCGYLKPTLCINTRIEHSRKQTVNTGITKENMPSRLRFMLLLSFDDQILS